MDALAKHIEHDLQERRFCVLFEDELERCWPKTERISQAHREKMIRSFAESHGWIVSVADTRAIFAGKDAPFLA